MITLEVLESPYLNHHFTQKQDYIRYTDAIQLGSYVHKKFNKIKFTQTENELILKVQSELESAFDVKLNIPWMMSTHILNFQYDYKKYVELFKKESQRWFLSLWHMRIMPLWLPLNLWALRSLNFSMEPLLIIIWDIHILKRPG